MVRIRPALRRGSNSKSKILDSVERGCFARFLKPSTNFSRILECRGENSFIRGLFVDGWRLEALNREQFRFRFGIAGGGASYLTGMPY